MNGEAIVLIAFVFLIIFIIFLSTRKSSDKNIRKARELEQQGKFLDAFDYYSRISLEQVANMVLRTPEALQVLVLRKLERKYSPRQIEKVFIQLARTNISRKDPHAAASALC